MNEYRQNAINHLKTHLGCVGYRDYLVTELEKLAKIEEIINETNRRESVLVNPEPKIIVRSMGFDKIREVLENE